MLTSSYLGFVAATCIFLPIVGKALPPSEVDSSICKEIKSKNYDPGSCEILIDLPSTLNTYENQKAQFRLVTTDECTDVILLVNGTPYVGAEIRSESRSISCNNVTATVFDYQFEPEIVPQNGSRMKLQLTDEEHNKTISNTTIILVIGPPISPKNIMADDYTCTGVNISWSQSPNAQCYVLSIKCGDTSVVQNSTVYRNTYQLSYHTSLQEQCKISVYSVNKAGNSTISSIRKNIAKAPEYVLPDHGVILNRNSAIPYFNITVDKDCPFSRPQYYNVCVDGRCVTDTIRDYNEISKLPLPLQKHVVVTIEVCTLANCTNHQLSLSTFSVQSGSVSCDSNGVCYLHCKYARGRQIRGCVFVITQQKTNKQLPPVFVDNTENKTYTLESGTYNYTAYDWDGTDQWRDSNPADTGQITVKRNSIDDNTGIEIGGGLAAIALVIAIFILVIVTIIVTRKIIRRNNQRELYRTDQGIDSRDPENQVNNKNIPLELQNFRRLDTAGSTDNREVYDRMFVENSNFCNSNQVPEATNGVTSTTDLNKERKGSTPLLTSAAPSTSASPLTSAPPSTSASPLTSTPLSAEPKNKERRVEHDTETDTTTYGSDQPLLKDKRQKESGGNKLRSEISYPDHQPSHDQYANRSQEETGRSTTTGCPTVTDEGKDEPAAYAFGNKTKPLENEDFTVASSSQAQSSDSNIQMVSGVDTPRQPC